MTPAGHRPAPRVNRGEQRALARLAATGRPVFCGGSRPYAALTFDDGPGPYTPLALRILRSARLPATFFLVGRNLAPFPGLAREEGRSYALGDHTWTHPYLPGLGPAAIRDQISSTRTAVERAAGVPVSLFRPPYGARTPVVDATARALKLVQVLWSVDSADSLGPNYAGIAHNVLSGLRPGAIILMHENRGQTIRALKFLILPHLAEHHLRLVTVPELLSRDPPSAAQLARGAQGCGTASPSRASG